MTPPIIIRPSYLSGWPDCQRRTAARMFPSVIRDWGYQLNPREPSVGAIVGTATHSAVAHILQAKMDTGELGNITEMEHRGLESLTKELSFGVSWDETTPSQNVAQQQVVRQAKAYRATTAQRVIPIAVERRLECKTAAGNTLSGQIDCMTDAIRDTKTGRVQRQNIVQYGGYALLVKWGGGQVSRLVEDYIKRVSVKQDQPAPIEISYNTEFAEILAARVIASVEAEYAEFAQTGDNLVFSANPSSQLCGPKYCTAFGTNFCREHRGAQ